MKLGLNLRMMFAMSIVIQYLCCLNLYVRFPNDNIKAHSQIRPTPLLWRFQVQIVLILEAHSLLLAFRQIWLADILIELMCLSAELKYCLCD